MRFLLEPGDAAAARPCAPAALRPGELALLVKWEGGRPAGYVIHRVVLNATLGGRRLLLTRGDANFLPDLPPSRFQPVARIETVSRGGLSWSAAPGALWPLASAYSFAANKLLFGCVYGAYLLISAAIFCLPRPFAALLNAVYLFLEVRLYPAVLSLAASAVRPRAAIAAGGQGALKSGRITSDETWSGRITVADYLTIERGVRVTVLPGAEIKFARSSSWFFPVLRAGDDGSRRELDSGLAKALVYGEFAALGGKEAPISIGGESFGGIHALGSGKISFRNCTFSDSGSWALSARDHAFLDAEGVTFSACRRGAEVSGQGAAFLKKCDLSGLDGPAARVLDGACLIFSRGTVKEAAAPAFEITGSARAAFYGAEVTQSACAFSASGRTKLVARDCVVRGAARGAVDLKEDASFEASGCLFDGGAFGLAATGTPRIALAGCLYTGNKGQAVTLNGEAGFSAERCSFEGNLAGISATGRSRIGLTGCSFSGNAGPAVEIKGGNRLDARVCSFNGGESGIEGLGLNRVKVRNSKFSAIKGAAVGLERPAELDVAFTVFDGNGAGLTLEACRRLQGADLNFTGNAGPAVHMTGAGKVLLRRALFSANGSGLDLGGDAEAALDDCAFERQTGTDASFAGRAWGEFRGCTFRGGGTSLGISGRAEVAAEKCVFDGNLGPAAEVSGLAELRLADCAVSGKEASLVFAGRSFGSFARVAASSGPFPALSTADRAGVSASGCSFSAGTDAVYCTGSGHAGFHGCVLASRDGAALNLRGGAADLEASSLSGRGGITSAYSSSVALREVEINSEAYGIDSSAASFSAEDLFLRGGALGGIVFSAGRNRLIDVRLEGAPAPGIALAAPATLGYKRVVVAGRQWRPPRPARSSVLKKNLFRLAAATAGWPVFSSIYLLIYTAAVPAARLLLRGRGLRALYLYRGMADRGWVPGLSDMDLACVLETASPAQDYETYSRLRLRLRLLKTLFPFTGELMLATEGDFKGFLNCWGVKGAEFPGASRLLAGRSVEVKPGASGAGLGDATEAFYAYTLLMRHFFSEGLPETFLRRNCLKNLVDIRRYLDVAAPARLSRAAYAAGLGLPLEHFMKADKGDYAYQAFSALHSAAPSAQAVIGSRPSSVGPRPGGWFNTNAFEAVCREMEKKSGLEMGVALDSLYRAYVVLPDAAAGDKKGYLRACAVLKEARAASPLLSASPMVLTERAFALISRLPYLNNPLLWAGLPGRSGGGSGPEDGGVYTYNLLPVPPAPDAAGTRAAALSAARHFCASWRSLWHEMPPHYFYTRAAGLRLLLETGDSPEFSDPVRLREVLLERTGFAAPAWPDYLAGGAGRAGYEHISAQAAVLGRLADAG